MQRAGTTDRLAWTTAAATALALLAFAANSILCRQALGSQAIDAASFTSLRLGSGALLLVLFMRSRGPSRAGWRSAGFLFVYAICFSLAYNHLSAGTGALILFGSVQVTMLLSALRTGERLAPAAWLGFAVALIGLTVLVLPGLEAPDPSGAALMAVSGAAWGFYSLLGRGSTAPVADTATSFVRATPMALAVSLMMSRSALVTPTGVGLAVLSGAVTSGLGYVIWYAALAGLSASRAAAVQLLVPVIAALGGAVVLSETVTPRLMVATIMVLGGVGLVVALRARTRAH